MALVAYGSSDESDLSDTEEQEVTATNLPEVEKRVETKIEAAAKPGQRVVDTNFGSGEISDEDDDEWISQAPAGVEDLDIPGLSNSRSIFDVLPQASLKKSDEAEPEPADYIDENEDLSTIPAAKAYESDLPKLTSKKSRKGPVRIMAPSLNHGEDSDDDSSKQPFVPLTGASKKSNLLSLLPPPKNSVSFAAKTSSDSTSIPTPKAGTSTLIPRSVSRPPVPSVTSLSKRRKVEKDSDESDDDDVSFFTLEKEEIPESAIEAEIFKSRLATVQSTPHADVHHEPYSNDVIINNDVYGPAVAPYPPLAPLPSTSSSDNLIEDEEALQRLVGKSALRKKRPGEEINFIEVKNDDIKPDPREWMTKALTEESERGEPGPKCNIKGEKKRKHQITYLAALAKEREHVLKQQWAQNAQTRRATQSKYGF